ncbi:MAG: hypothetical protein KA985_00850 [Selenomonas sp.]|jgi:hypothetical protein|uniref:antitoxin VbhA family protein n=1 Tax=uncultured Selenomonas sp. TaxID=159275 RepID=UPI001B516BE0|nr:hypothetical protein [uncultured Selenomonas sp.]MBP7249523.1 hypothetical protein [Selenomonas sp.]
MTQRQTNVRAAMQSSELEGVTFSPTDCEVFQQVAAGAISPEQARKILVADVLQSYHEAHAL